MSALPASDAASGHGIRSEDQKLADAPLSLLMASAWMRVLGALLPVAALWLAVAWALR